MTSPTADRVPEKWRKYSLLALFGLTTEDELLSTITRYPWKERALVGPRLSEMLASSQPNSLLIVVKLVPLYLGRQLPNYRVNQPEDLAGLDEFILNTPGHFSEVWHCTTAVDASVFSASGRIAFRPGGMPNQVVEQVWRCSPRMIELFGQADFPWPYARASRSSWGWRWRAEQLFVPRGDPLSLRDVQDGLSRAMKAIQDKHEILEAFVEAIEACGISSHSIEYKVVGEHLSVIDWDTSDDRKVLRAFYD